MFSVGLSLYKLVGNLPERKPLQTNFAIFGASRVWDGPLSAVSLFLSIQQPRVKYTGKRCVFFSWAVPVQTGGETTGNKNPCANRFCMLAHHVLGQTVECCLTLCLSLSLSLRVSKCISLYK